MRKTTTIALAGALIMLLGATLDARWSTAAETTANDCLIAIEDEAGTFTSTGKVSTYSCTDGAACDADGATDGKCTLSLAACVRLAGCESRALKKSKVNPKKLGITVPSSACGSFVNVVLSKTKGKKSKKKITAIGIGTESPAKRNKDTDKVKASCVPCPTASCVPATTSTTVTVTTTSTSTTTNPCGNGTIDAGETCDPDAVPNGCSGGTPFCNVATCGSCQADCTQLAFKTGLPTPACSFPGGSDPGQPPYTGEIDGDPVGSCVGGNCNNGDPGTGSGACTVDTDCNACKAGNCDNGSLGNNGAGACGSNADCAKLFDLGASCLYIGGGLASLVPPGPTPDGSTTIFDVTDCSQNSLALTPADTGSSRTCTVGPSTTSKHCVNGHPGNGNGVCDTDADCQPVCVNQSGAQCNGEVDCHCIDGAPGLPGKDLGTCNVQGTCGDTPTGTCSGDSNTPCNCNLECNGGCNTNSNCGVSSAGGSATLVCLPDSNCFFGNPLPINNLGTSTCVLNVIDDGVTGTADKGLGTSISTVPLKSWVFLTGVDQDNFANGNACPICDSGTCNAGPNKGLACTTNSSLKTTHDCPPPPYLFLAPLSVTLGPLTSATAMSTSDSAGIFCNPQMDGGAFGLANARKLIENGSPAAGPLSVTNQDATLASIFCIPGTNNLLIDASANLPGPGAIALPGSVRLR
jgi:hypothetical protein